MYEVPTSARGGAQKVFMFYSRQKDYLLLMIVLGGSEASNLVFKNIPRTLNLKPIVIKVPS